MLTLTLVCSSCAAHEQGPAPALRARVRAVPRLATARRDLAALPMRPRLGRAHGEAGVLQAVLQAVRMCSRHHTRHLASARTTTHQPRHLHSTSRHDLFHSPRIITPSHTLSSPHPRARPRLRPPPSVDRRDGQVEPPRLAQAQAHEQRRVRPRLSGLPALAGGVRVAGVRWARVGGEVPAFGAQAPALAILDGPGNLLLLLLFRGSQSTECALRGRGEDEKRGHIVTGYNKPSRVEWSGVIGS